MDSGDSASIFETGVVSVGVGKSFSSGVARTGVDAGTGVVGGIGVAGGKGVGGLRLFVLACMTSFSTFCQLCLQGNYSTWIHSVEYSAMPVNGDIKGIFVRRQ
jgi:hypothetical protein